MKGTRTINLVARLLSEITEQSVEAIGPETRLREDLDVDSLAVIELATLLTEETGKDFSEDDFADVTTVSEIVQVVDMETS